MEGLQAAQKADKDIAIIIQLLEKSAEKPACEEIAPTSSDVKTLWAQWPRLAIQDGVLNRRIESADGLTEYWQVVFPAVLRGEFLGLAHEGMTGGHFGRRRSAAAIQARAYWLSWSSDLDSFIKRCEPCVTYHRGAVPRRAKLKPCLLGAPWERVSIDITGPHPPSYRHNRLILTCVDHFSKWAQAIPLTNHTAAVVSRALMTHVFSRYGTPLQLLSDRGPEFESELFSGLIN